MGAFHFGRQDYAAAVAEYGKATAINPAFSQPYNQMGYAYRFLGQYQEAERAFKKYIELIPNDPNPYDSYAELLMKMGRFEESIKSYEKALAVDPNFVASYVGIGNDRVFMGQPAEARKTYAKLLAIARNDGEKLLAHFWTAMSYVHEGQTDEALAELQKNAAIDQAGEGPGRALRHDRPDGRTSCSRRVAWTRRRRSSASGCATIDKADVAAQVKEAAQRQALFDEARVALARNDVASAKAKAVRLLRTPSRPRASRSSCGRATSSRGRIALAEKSYDAAAAELRQANQQDPRVLYLTAMALQGKGDVLAAKQAGVAGRRLQRPVQHLRLRSGQGPGDAEDGEGQLAPRGRPRSPRGLGSTAP